MEDGREVESSSMWRHLPLLVRASSKESVEYILEALWRTRRTGLDAADRQIFRDILQLPPNDCRLDPLLVCLRVLIRRCVYDNVNKDEIQKLFPAEVLPELQRLLTLLLQKFQKEWREDVISKDQRTGSSSSYKLEELPDFKGARQQISKSVVKSDDCEDVLTLIMSFTLTCFPRAKGETIWVIMSRELSL